MQGLAPISKKIGNIGENVVQGLVPEMSMGGAGQLANGGKFCVWRLVDNQSEIELGYPWPDCLVLIIFVNIIPE